MIFLVAGINVTLTAFILIGAPVVITQILGLPNQYMGFAEGALALGGLAGGVSVGVFAGRLRLSRAPLFLLVAALGLLPIAVVLGVPMDAMLAYGIVVAGLFASMACATMFSIQAISFVQLETPGHLVGKVIALTMSLANCAQPVGQLIYGGLFDALRGNLVPVALGTAAIAFVIGLVTFRVLRKGLAELQAELVALCRDRAFAWMYRVWLGGRTRKGRRARAFSMTESRRFLPEFPVSYALPGFAGC